MSEGGRVLRLFTALELPPHVRRALAGLQPPAERGISPVAFERMHLTLHFIGDADPAHVSSALAAVRGRPFALRIGALGMFSRRGRPAALWAGVDHEDSLHALHASIGEALVSAGYEIETRAYRPHVTLARLTPRACHEAVRNFLARGAIEPIDLEVHEFVLFSSETRSEGGVYRSRARFGLDHNGARS